MSPSRTSQRRLHWGIWLLAGACMIFSALPGAAAPQPGIEVDQRDAPSMTQSAIRAFDHYLHDVDAGNLEAARSQVLDPGHNAGRLTVVQKLLSFIRTRMMSEIANEGVVVRLRGDWALIVYQYDTTRDSKTTRVITTAWMVQNDGYWRQLIVSPQDNAFWNKRRSDYEALQRWFDEHARRITGETETPIVLPV